MGRFADAGQELDDTLADVKVGIDALNDRIDRLDARVTALEGTSPPPPPPPPPGDDPYPPAKVTVHVDPSNAHELLRQVSRAVAGTHFVLEPGGYDLCGHNLGGTVAGGTADNPIVIRAATDEMPVIKPRSWTIGEYGGCLNVYGSNLVFDGLVFDTEHLLSAGRLLNIYAWGQRHISENVLVLRCAFTGSWRHALVMQGKNHRVAGCAFNRNCRFNQDGTRGVWPFTAGPWWYWLDDATKAFSENMVFSDCLVSSSYGEGLCCNYTIGGSVIGCDVRDCRFAGIYMMNSHYSQVLGNRIRHTGLLGDQRGSDFRGIEMSIETYGSYPVQQEPMSGLISGNTVDGNGRIRHALRINPHRTPNATYDGITIRNNTWGETKDNVLQIEKMPVTPRANSCSIDKLPDHPRYFIGDPEAWNIRSAPSMAVSKTLENTERWGDPERMSCELSRDESGSVELPKTYWVENLRDTSREQWFRASNPEFMACEFEREE